jgi:hypothetical protein
MPAEINVPPIRMAFFEGTVGDTPVSFVRTGLRWSEWCAAVVRRIRALGNPQETLTATAALDFPLVAAGGTQDLTMTVTGVLAADVAPVVSVGLPAGLNAGLLFHGWVSANNTVTIRATNATAAGINPGSATFRVEVRRY